MRHSKNTQRKKPPESEISQLRQAVVSLLYAETPEEREKVFLENPILLKPEAITYINSIIKHFNDDSAQNVTVVDGIQQQWRERRKFLELKQGKGRLHETDA